MKIQHITYRELKAMVSEKSFALIILLEFLLVTSSGLLSVGYVLLTSPESSNTANQLASLVYVGVVTDTPEIYYKAFSDTNVKYTFYSSYVVAKSDFKDGLIDTLLVGDISLGREPAVLQVYLPSNNPKTPLTKLALKKILTKLETEVRVEKVDEFASNVELADYKIMNYRLRGKHMEIYYVFTIPLLLFLPSVIAGSLSIDSITQDLESKRILNLLLAPLSYLDVVLGKILSALVISVVQAILWTTIIDLFFVPVENKLALISVTTLYTVFFMNCGAAIALHLKKMKNSQIFYTFFSMSAISLFSPFANLHPLLQQASPAYLLAKLSLGHPTTNYLPHILILTLLSVLTTLYLNKIAGKITET
ncbi:MAG: ABC transporter permease [Candidatus Altiarchaeota archaeon]|nr:ABC transporter permease [Candidatus Altiarchaeota archaeon]